MPRASRSKATKDEDARIEWVPLAELQQWPRNPKTHHIPGIKESIKRFGFISPIIVDERSGKMVAGHGRLEAVFTLRVEGEDPPARVKQTKDGDWSLPVLRGVSFADEKAAEAYLLADNRHVELGGWDETLLAQILEDTDRTSLPAIGWDERELERVIAESRESSDPVLRDSLPEERLGVYQDGAIKQIVLYYAAEDFAAIMARCTAAMDKLGVEDMSALFNFLLDAYDGGAPD